MPDIRQPPWRPSRPVIFGTLVAMLVLSGLDQALLSAALPLIAGEFHGSDRASWVFSAYLAASTTVIPLYGKLADRWGTRRLLLAAIGLFTLGSVACGLATGMDALIAARALQGLGGGGLMILTMLSVTDLYSQAERGGRMGRLGAAYGLATMAGPLLGAVIAQHLSWRWAFFGNVPLALAACGVLAVARFGLPRAVRHRLDVAGAVLLAGFLACLLLATRSGGGAGGGGVAAGAAALSGAAASSVTSAAFDLAAALLAALWLYTERRAEDPIVPLSLFKRGSYRAITLLSMISGVALFAAVVFLPLYLQLMLHVTPIASAWHLLPLMAGLRAAVPVASRSLRARQPPRRLAMAGTASMLLSFSALTWVFAHAASNAWLISACVLPLGLGLGLLFPVLSVVSQRTAPPQQIGIATALPVMLRALGGALGVALLGELLARQAAGHGLAGGMQAVFSAAALAALAGLLLSRWVPVGGSAAQGQKYNPAPTVPGQLGIIGKSYDPDRTQIHRRRGARAPLRACR
ncbi:MAG: MFS transporter [Burkholderiales bacterium]|nr:MFS transporter [Burkholderiales bacterium]